MYCHPPVNEKTESGTHLELGLWPPGSVQHPHPPALTRAVSTGGSPALSGLAVTARLLSLPTGLFHLTFRSLPCGAKTLIDICLLS